MKTEDLLALAALAGGLSAFKKKSGPSKQSEALNEFIAKYRKETPEEASAARFKAATEELNPESRIGSRRTPMTDRYGNPVSTRYGGYAFTEDIPDSAVRGDNFRRNVGMKKGGATKKYAKGGTVKSSASKRADGCAQRGKTKGRII